MLIPVKSACLLGLLTLSPVMAAEEPEIEFFLFLADFTDEKGDWDAPEMDEQSTQSDETGVEK